MSISHVFSIMCVLNRKNLMMNLVEIVERHQAIHNLTHETEACHHKTARDVVQSQLGLLKFYMQTEMATGRRGNIYISTPTILIDYRIDFAPYEPDWGLYPLGFKNVFQTVFFINLDERSPAEMRSSVVGWVQFSLLNDSLSALHLSPCHYTTFTSLLSMCWSSTVLQNNLLCCVYLLEISTQEICVAQVSSFKIHFNNNNSLSHVTGVSSELRMSAAKSLISD